MRDQDEAVDFYVGKLGFEVHVYVFPDTDHGMVELRVNTNGSRTPTRITDGYLSLLADWIKGSVNSRYGRGRKAL